MERPTSTLDALVARLQQRYGSRAAQRGAAVPPPAAPQALATGHAALDAALPHRGLPRGRLTTIHGPRSAGATTLALTTIAQAQAAGDPACLLDLTQTFAPVAAAACGVRLADLAVARPVDGDAAALVVATLLARRAVGALVIDSLPAWLALPRGPAALAALLPRLPRLLAASGCALIVLHPFPTGLLPDAAAPLHTIPAPLTALRLRLAHQDWLRRGPQIVGCRTGVTVLAPPFDHAYATAMVEIHLAEALTASMLRPYRADDDCLSDCAAT